MEERIRTGLAVVGLALVGTGVGMISVPAALIVVGVVLCAVAVIGSLRKR
jgi:hypothetical protein